MNKRGEKKENIAPSNSVLAKGAAKKATHNTSDAVTPKIGRLCEQIAQQKNLILTLEDEKQKLEWKIDSQGKTIKELNDKIDSFEKRLKDSENTTSQLDNFKRTNLELEQLKSEYEARARDAECELENLKEELLSKTNEAENANIKCESMQENINAQESELAELKNQLESIQKQFDEYKNEKEAEINDIQSKMELNAINCDEIEEKVVKKNQINAELTRENNGLKSQIEEMQANIEKLNSEMKSVVNQNENMIIQIKDLEKYNAELIEKNKKIEEVESVNMKLNKQIDSLNGNILKLKELNSANEAEKEKMYQDQLDVAINELCDLKQIIEEKDAEISDYNNQISKLKKDLQEAKAEQISQSKATSEQKGRSNRLEEEMEKLKFQISEMNNDIARRDSEIRRLKNDLNGTETSLKQEKSGFESIIRHKEDEISESKQKLKKLQDTIEEKDAMIHQLRIECDTVNSKAQKLSQESLRAKDAEDRVNKAEAKLSLANNEIKDLNAKMSQMASSRENDREKTELAGKLIRTQERLSELEREKISKWAGIGSSLEDIHQEELRRLRARITTLEASNAKRSDLFNQDLSVGGEQRVICGLKIRVNELQKKLQNVEYKLKATIAALDVSEGVIKQQQDMLDHEKELRAGVNRMLKEMKI